MLLRSKKCYIFKNIYLFLCLKVIFDTLGSFWLKNSSDFGKVQFCPELSSFRRFYPILATGEDFSTIVRLFYKPWSKVGPSCFQVNSPTKIGRGFENDQHCTVEMIKLPTLRDRVTYHIDAGLSYFS